MNRISSLLFSLQGAFLLAVVTLDYPHLWPFWMPWAVIAILSWRQARPCKVVEVVPTEAEITAQRIMRETGWID